ncbi:MAG: hypothetical protein R3175_07540 [Marinobacter sp.]|uniref:hypothetical protein n=1 Tax=Marinobacter sp. TaxID=50741 RepID=UPI00299D0EAD|nr:hypothetical protein [Marinobacter sp.]MDX1755893.1 hypothetical protein [Marinobacter sp.]
MVKLWFCRSNDIGGWLIRLLTWSQWNHVAIEVNGYIYEAVTDGGVRRIHARGYGDSWDDAQSVRVPVDDLGAVLLFLQNQVGKPYDWRALPAIPFRWTWQHPHKWFCSELAAKALMVGGRDVTSEKAYRVTPQDLSRVLMEGAAEAEVAQSSPW